MSWQKNKSAGEKKTRGTDRKRFSWGLWAPVAAAFLLAALCSGLLFQLVRVQGASMEPAMSHNNWILSSPGAYRNASPERGDVILFQRSSLTRGFIIKRVIGLPGETVEIRDGTLYINETPVEDLWGVGTLRENMAPVFVEPECYFVMGDNREYSVDSRSWEEPLVHRKELRGKAEYVVLPKLIKIW